MEVRQLLWMVFLCQGLGGFCAEDCGHKSPMIYTSAFTVFVAGILLMFMPPQPFQKMEDVLDRITLGVLLMFIGLILCFATAGWNIGKLL